jgi:hypothetical protein
MDSQSNKYKTRSTKTTPKVKSIAKKAKKMEKNEELFKNSDIET